tara:strand:+ start:284 stop:451 length:168 start_codon:yes stop_codon:yes gene_type:complete
MIEKTLAVINSCINSEQLKGAVRYARLARHEDNVQVKIAILSQSHALGLPIPLID